MGCKLTNNITKKNCAYSVAGVIAIYLINYVRGIKYTETEGVVSAISLEEGATEALKAYKVDFEKNTASFSDDLAEGGNGGKYRTHTLNFSVGSLEYSKLNDNADALSLGRFIAVVFDKNGQGFILGRGNGLDATSTNYASGAADADASGWSVVMVGNEKESMKPIKDDSVITAILHKDEGGAVIP